MRLHSGSGSSGGNYRARPTNSRAKKNDTKKTNENSEIGLSYGNFKKKINVSPANGGKFKILQVAYCNINFDKKAAIPLQATDKGFSASLNIEITIEMMKENPKSFEVNVTVGGKNSKIIELKHIENGIYRSTKIHEFSISYKDISK